MDEQTLQARLDRIERLLYLLLVLVAVPYFVALADLVGYWVAGIATAGLAIVAFAAVAGVRRRNRAATGQ